MASDEWKPTLERRVYRPTEKPHIRMGVYNLRGHWTCNQGVIGEIGCGDSPLSAWCDWLDMPASLGLYAKRPSTT